MNDPISLQLALYGRLTIQPKGHSMLPFLRENRNEVVLTPPSRPIRKFDVVLYRHGEVYVLHRVIGIRGDILTICGDNSAVSEEVTVKHIIGAAEAVVRGGRTYRGDRPVIRLCVRIWYMLGIKRAVLLGRAVYRRIRRLTAEKQRSENDRTGAADEHNDH